MLHEPDRHQPLDGTPWDARRARHAIRSIVDDIERSRRPAGHWPVHPLDDEGDAPPSGYKSLYLGSAGIAWALWYLQRAGAVERLKLDPLTLIEQAEAAYRAAPDTGQVVPSYFLGEVGIGLLHWCMGRSAAVADRLYASVRSNIGNPTNEALWAAPGTMVAAWHLWRLTAEARWRHLFADNVEQLWRSWRHDDAAGCHLWTQDLYGQVVQYLGAGHGFAGNAHALLRGASLLDAARREQLYDRCAETLQATAQHDGDAANWPVGTFAARPGRPRVLLQWCHGAPGFVTAMADLPSSARPAVEPLLLAAGQAIWRAGPLAKGPGICHGTAGNGYALLALHRRTGDPLWLARARAFAAHAIGQCERLSQQVGHGRHTLWTGDAGLAVFLWHCVQGAGGLPALDVVD